MRLLPELYQPMTVGPMQVANRLMMAGMSAGTKMDENGDITPEMIAYYVERARGQPGMMAVGASSVVPPSPELERSHGAVALYSDRIIPSLRRLVDAVHQYDTKFGIQLWNGGGTEGTGVGELISPSGLSSNVRNARADAGGRKTGQPNRALDLDEIEQIVRYFADGAVRVAEAGFDFVEIHAGHGYLISNFLTPLFNRRTDRYGGSFENRTRFLLEITAAVKAAVGDRIAVGVKYNGDDFLGGDGWTLAESARLAPLVEAAGADYITVTAGLVGSPKLTIPPMYEPQGCYTDLAEAVKPTVSIPVGTIGRIKDPIMARDLVAAGKADFVCLGRPTIADSDIFGKTRRGELEDIRPCLADCRGCIDEHLRRGGAASCVVNPRMARELTCIDIEGSARDNPKTVLVVGGGLAGLEAARRTAFSGHKVILCETRPVLGGQINFAAMIPGRTEIADMLPWYERQLLKYRVDIRLGTTVDAALLAEIAPDVVFVASGSSPEVPQDMLDVVMNAANIEIMMLDDLLEQKLKPGNNILVIGGDQNGMLAADYLSEGGRQVCVAEATNHFAEKLAGHDRWYLLNRQNAKNVRRVKGVHGVEVGGNDDVWLLTDDGRQELPGIDTIVFASDRRSNRTVAEMARDMGLETYVVGDAHDVVSENGGTIFANIAHAYDVARQV
jgi:2,4-dienoyl-CoA reductase-like NADH-dependent reductase (Old Yellow Enzyme family)/thioredoxin reductase